MKTINYIYLAFAALLVTSCIRENYSDLSETRGLMSIDILDNNGEAVDKIEKIRFIIFKDASGSPTLELNQLFNIPDVAPGNNEVSKFEITLEVSRKKSGINKKIVVVVINEPASIKTTLDRISNYNTLVNLQLNFADFLNNDHSSLQDGKTMPMTGVIWTDKVYETRQEAESDPAEMKVFRAVAGVEVYIRKEAGIDFDLGIGTNVTLRNTYDKEYFIRNEDGSETFGNIQTIASGFISKSKTVNAVSNIPDITPGSNGLFICSFYTPERTCFAPNNTDKLILDITALSTGGESRSTITALDEFNINNIKTAIENIERNHIYRVILTVTDIGLNITVIVVDWSEENIMVEF